MANEDTKRLTSQLLMEKNELLVDEKKLADLRQVVLLMAPGQN